MPPQGTIIACPKCHWQPEGHEQDWQCTCGQQWHTFDTAGKCPSCQYQWSDTTCLHCHCVSRHADWYRSTAVRWAEQVILN
jgi:hypothetical protein